MGTSHAASAGQVDRSVPNRTRYQAAPRPDFSAGETPTASLTPRQARAAADEVFDMFADAYHQALREIRAGAR